MSLDPSINRLTYRIIESAIAVHRALGPGLLESAYFPCLRAELLTAQLRVDVDVRVPLIYKTISIDCAYRIDMVVNGTVVLELKSVSSVLPIHEAQLLTYLKLTGKPLGLILNFNVPVMKDGIVRKINAD